MSHSMPPACRHICVSAMRPSAGSRFAQRRSRNASAPGPETRYFEKLVWSSAPTAERTARPPPSTARETNGSALLADRVVPVPAPHRVLVARAVAGEPEGPLPAEAEAHHRTALAEHVVQRVPLHGATRVALLLRVVDRVLARVDVDSAWDQERRRARVVAEAADVELPHVVARLAVDDPLGGVASCAAREDDPEYAEPGQHVEVAQAGHRPHQAAAVGRVRVRA